MPPAVELAQSCPVSVGEAINSVECSNGLYKFPHVDYVVWNRSTLQARIYPARNYPAAALTPHYVWSHRGSHRQQPLLLFMHRYVPSEL